jgi:hypothetical protein
MKVRSRVVIAGRIGPDRLNGAEALQRAQADLGLTHRVQAVADRQAQLLAIVGRSEIEI